jgi:peptidoglycan/LPS O-acetylase OafA/YrhL
VIEERDNRGGRYDFRSFYWRRAFRLGPALLLWLAVIAPLTAVAVDQASTIPIASVASLFYFSDFAIAAGVSLGDAYTHVWSLSIEEQFYAVWPWILVACLLTRPAAIQRRALLIAVPVSVVVMVVAGHVFSNDYFLPTGHIVSLVVGCLAGSLFVRGGGRRLEALLSMRYVGLVCLGLLALAMIAYRPLGIDIGALLLLAIAATTAVLLLHLCLRPQGPAHAVLTTTPALWLGRRSYGLYLFHRTFTLLIPALIPGITLRYAGPLALAITFVVAELSFRYLERPVNHRGRAWLRREHTRVPKAESTLPITSGA